MAENKEATATELGSLAEQAVRDFQAKALEEAAARHSKEKDRLIKENEELKRDNARLKELEPYAAIDKLIVDRAKDRNRRCTNEEANIKFDRLASAMFKKEAVDYAEAFVSKKVGIPDPSTLLNEVVFQWLTEGGLVSEPSRCRLAQLLRAGEF